MSARVHMEFHDTKCSNLRPRVAEELLESLKLLVLVQWNEQREIE